MITAFTKDMVMLSVLQNISSRFCGRVCFFSLSYLEIMRPPQVYLVLTVVGLEGSRVSEGLFRPHSVSVCSRISPSASSPITPSHHTSAPSVLAFRAVLPAPPGIS